jgi:hypothetical protein
MESVTKLVTIAGVMTAGRSEITFARNYIELALKEAGVPLTVSGGVYYGQCMQVMLEGLVGKVDYALTVDGDSMFTARHVQRLLSIIAEHEQIDAIAAVQPKRGCGEILAARKEGSRTVDWTGFPIQVDSAHFGLTVIDMKKLATVPKPWFWAQPNGEGGWDGSKIDDDVYFWKKWQEAGNRVFVDPGCRLGHLEEVITVFDDKMELQQMYPKQWSENRDSTVD